jgi:hypothetical protein
VALIVTDASVVIAFQDPAGALHERPVPHSIRNCDSSERVRRQSRCPAAGQRRGTGAVGGITTDFAMQILHSMQELRVKQPRSAVGISSFG